MSPTRLCGFPFTTQLAIDMLDALPASRARRPRRDPQGHANLRLFRRARSRRREYPGLHRRDLKAAGFTKLTTRIYPGARHETLNETNRDEVTRDLIAWLDGAVGG